MPLNDIQLTGVLNLLLIQHKEILNLKAHIFALSKIAGESLGYEAVEGQLRAYATQFLQTDAARIHDSAETLRLLEEAVLQLGHAPDPNSGSGPINYLHRVRL